MQLLSTGDTIGIVAPSDPVSDLNKDFGAGKKQFEQGITFLESLGFNVKIGKNTHSVSLGYAASDKEKADDINMMFADDAVNGIICAQGGNNSNALLNYLDYNTIRNNPKIILGISDITSVLNAIYTKTGITTFHGNDIMWGFGREHKEYDKNEFVSILIQGREGIIKQNQDWRCISEGKGSGTLIGGNIDTFMKLVGTQYMPTIKGSILALEHFGEFSRPNELHAHFAHMHQLGIFDEIQGILLGNCGFKDGTLASTVLGNVLCNKKNLPIVECTDFGHNCPNTVLGIGSQVELYSSNEKCYLKVLDSGFGRK